MRLLSSTVSGNTGQSGGGVYINRGLFEARNCTISGNTSTGPGSYGGGLFLSGLAQPVDDQQLHHHRKPLQPPQFGRGRRRGHRRDQHRRAEHAHRREHDRGRWTRLRGHAHLGWSQSDRRHERMRADRQHPGKHHREGPLARAARQQRWPDGNARAPRRKPCHRQRRPGGTGRAWDRLSLDRSARLPPAARQGVRHRGGGGSRWLSSPRCRAHVDRQRGANPVAGGRKRFSDGSDGQAFPPG